jgi:hypothetical protein
LYIFLVLVSKVLARNAGSVVDPDPYVFEPSGSFHQEAKEVRKT